MLLLVLLAPRQGLAAPGQAERLAGVEAQGPATRSVTALHHNPAMLAQMPGLNATLTLRGGLDQLGVRRFPVDASGEPTGDPGTPVTLLQPAGGYFVGASYRLDPVAIGAGVYTLGSRFRPRGDDALRYHHIGDPDLGCLTRDGAGACPDTRRGGAREHRTDWTLALAWNAYDRAQIGASFHFPRLSMAFAREEDTSLRESGPAPACGTVSAPEVEDPRCSERLTFDGRTRLRWFGLDPNGSRFDFAITVGVAVPIGERVTLGLRYRSPPLLDRGQVTLDGTSLVCLGSEAHGAELNDLPRCAQARPVRARVTQRLPQEAAIGASVALGKRRELQLDSNFFWTDYCPGGRSLHRCGGRDAPILSLVGLDRDAQLPFEGPVHRGRADALGVELWGSYAIRRRSAPELSTELSGPLRSKPEVALAFGGGLISPAIRPSALTANDSEGWKIHASLGTTLELRRRGGSVMIVPGYGLDLLVPTRVGPGGVTAAYRPQIARDFAASGGDINGPSARAALAGRGRPSNAGRYFGSTHLLSFTVRWEERDAQRRP